MNIRSKALPLPLANVDTDQIIPAAFLKQTDKKGYSKNLFYNWRYQEDGSANPTFVLNNPAYAGAKVLVAGNNFGCGSSREHAAWAIADYGIQVVVSSQFADIFKGNALNNGILPIELPADQLELILNRLQANPETMVIVDLGTQTIEIPDLAWTATFAVDAFKKECLMQGVDETAYLLNMQQDIVQYEEKQLLA